MKKSIYKIIYYFVAFIAAFSFSGCSDSPVDESNTETQASTPVSLTHINIEPISESTELRATSVFQKKIAVKSALSGYIESAGVTIGQEVSEGQVLFTVKTKEASALQNINLNDTSLNFPGVVKVRAQKSGIITTLDHQKGDYVQEGDQLGIISERSSLVFILEVPFELHSYLGDNGTCDIILPDGQTVKGKVTGSLPSVDATSQTQSFVVTPMINSKLPENLIAKISIVKQTKEKAIVLPKLAVLADETQTDFWVMKLINDSTAIKISVKKGIETSDKVEIIEPVFTASDNILLNGNYGLADTAKVTVQKPEIN